MAQYMSDGSTSSIALKSVLIRNVLEKGNISWVHKSLMNIMGSNVSTHQLPSIVPGAVNPLLWWSTVNLQEISPPFLAVGIETMFSMLARSGMQRTLRTKQQRCVQNIEDPSLTVLLIKQVGFVCAMIFTFGQLTVNLICWLACIPRFLKRDPIAPAIKVCRDPSYFLLLLNGSFIGGILTEARAFIVLSDEIWGRLDQRVRIGETIATKDDPERGHITMDKPKSVTTLVKGKWYS